MELTQNISKYTYQVQFTNKTQFPIIVESWIIVMRGLSSMDGVTILSNDTVQINSDTGEWYIHNLFCSEHFQVWKKAGYDGISRIGKFTVLPTYSGEYQWSNYNEFQVVKNADGFSFENVVS